MTLLDRLRGRRRRDRAATASASPPRPAPEPTIRPVPVGLGPRDQDASGWRNRATGELVPGFDAFPGAVVLDAGCGDIPHSAFFADQDVEIVLADVVPEAVAAGARLVAREGSAARITELVTDINPLPMPEGSVDRIVATEVLEHVTDPEQFLAELVRVGKPGARYLLAVPDARSERLQEPVAEPGYFEPPNHVRVFTDQSFDQLIHDAGLVIEHKQYDGFYQSLWWSFFWVCAQPDLKAPWHPLLANWMRTWQELLELDRGMEVKQALDRLIPKSQVVVARKPEA